MRYSTSGLRSMSQRARAASRDGRLAHAASYRDAAMRAPRRLLPALSWLCYNFLPLGHAETSFRVTPADILRFSALIFCSSPGLMSFISSSGCAYFTGHRRLPRRASTDGRYV